MSWRDRAMTRPETNQMRRKCWPPRSRPCLPPKRHQPAPRCSNGDPLLIAQDGQAKASVVRAADAGDTESNAAADLVRYIELMSGARLALIFVARPVPGCPTPLPSSSAKRRWRRAPSLQQALARAAKKDPFPRADAVAQRRTGRHVLLAGNQRRIALLCRVEAAAGLRQTASRIKHQRISLRRHWRECELGEDGTRLSTVNAEGGVSGSAAPRASAGAELPASRSSDQRHHTGNSCTPCSETLAARSTECANRRSAKT